MLEAREQAHGSNEDAGVWHVRGHDGVVRTLRKSLDHPAHAYLILGPRGAGKKTLAIELAKALNCEASLSERPCQTCNSCELIDRMIHPDVSYLEPVEKASISIDQVRFVRRDLSILPNQGRWRVAIIQADLLTEPAADALLKTLEEPNDRVVLVLTGGDMFTIPETIVSRCRVVQLGLVGVEVISAELRSRGIDTQQSDELAQLAYGSVGWAVTASTKPDEVARRQSIRKDIARWGSTSLLDRLSAAESLAAAGKPDKVRALAMEELETMMTWWRDVLLASSGQNDLMVGAARPEDASSQTPATAVKAIREIATAATRIKENVDSRLTLEALGIGI